MIERKETAEEFFARGGKALELPIGISSDTIPLTKRVNGKPRALTKEEKEISRRASLHSYGKFNLRHAKIKKLVDGSFSYSLVIGPKRYGTFYSESDFILNRDKIYEELGLTFNDGKR